MKNLKIRNLELGSGIPAICIPNTGKTKEEILALTRGYLSLPMDLMEWRGDYFDNITEYDKVLEILKELRMLLGDTPLLFTFRTKKEGGVRPLSLETYIELNKTIAQSQLADLIDVEILTGDSYVSDLIDFIHESNVNVIASNHDFAKTPSKESMIQILCKMQDMKADILKLAVMPQNSDDVLRLMEATKEMVKHHAKQPVVTISMSDLGRITRVSGEEFGSCMTFGAGRDASAPGQIEALVLKDELEENSLRLKDKKAYNRKICH